MELVRKSFLTLSLAGFLSSLIIHLLALWGRSPSSESWLVTLFLGALLSWVAAAYLSGAKAGRMAAIPFSEVVKDCPTWLKRTDYFFSAYAALIFLGVALGTAGIFKLPLATGFLFLSAVCMIFYAGSFSMLFGKLFGAARRAHS